MILGLGIDAVEIERFENWYNYSHERLLRVFSEEEIKYCLSVPTKSAERFAARFVAKEACYKALSGFLNMPFGEFCRHVKVLKKENGAPYLVLNRGILNHDGIKFLVSITHTNTTAIASVIIFES